MDIGKYVRGTFFFNFCSYVLLNSMWLLFYHAPLCSEDSLLKIDCNIAKIMQNTNCLYSLAHGTNYVNGVFEMKMCFISVSTKKQIWPNKIVILELK